MAAILDLISCYTYSHNLQLSVTLGKRDVVSIAVRGSTGVSFVNKIRMVRGSIETVKGLWGHLALSFASDVARVGVNQCGKLMVSHLQTSTMDSFFLK